jgi:hypothetical protein
MKSSPAMSNAPRTGQDSFGNGPCTTANAEALYGKAAWAEMVQAFAALDWDGPSALAIDCFPGTPDHHVVYFVGGDEGPIKIGWTQNLRNRLPCIQNGSSVPLRVLATQRAPKTKERWYHKQFAKSRVLNEWFERTPELMATIDHLSKDAGND